MSCTKPELQPFLRKFSEFPEISLIDLILLSEDEEGMEKIRKIVNGKYVLLGETSPTLTDFGPTPLSGKDPLVVFHANRIDSLLAGIKIGELDPIILNILSIFAGIIFLIFARKGRFIAISIISVFLFSFLLSAIIFKLNYYFIAPFHVFLPPFFGLVFSGTYYWWHYQKFNNTLSNAFDSYVSPEILKWLKETGGEAIDQAMAQRRNISIMFTDIVGYTRLSNTLPPDKIMDSLHFYLDSMVNITNRNNGYIDKINGDGLMILFGAPKESENNINEAVNCAVEMQEKVKEMNDEWIKITGVNLEIRIGIASGYAFVGNLGGKGHIEYSAIGQSVNLAARLEPKSDKGGVLICSKCYENLSKKPSKGHWKEVELKGYSKPIKAFQIEL